MEKVLEWKYCNPEDGCVAAWGARLIYKAYPFTMDMLHDRQSCFGEQEKIEELIAWLNFKGWDKYKKLVQSKFLGGDSEEVIEFVENEFKIIGSPRGSYGYFYVTAMKLR